MTLAGQDYVRLIGGFFHVKVSRSFSRAESGDLGFKAER